MEEKDNHVITQINVNCNCGKCTLLPTLGLFPKEAKLQLRHEGWPSSEVKVKKEWSRQGENHV